MRLAGDVAGLKRQKKDAQIVHLLNIKIYL